MSAAAAVLLMAATLTATPSPTPTAIPTMSAPQFYGITLTATTVEVALMVRWDDSDPRAMPVQVVAEDCDCVAIVCRVTTRPDKKPRKVVGAWGPMMEVGFRAQAIRAPRKGEPAWNIRILPWRGECE